MAINNNTPRNQYSGNGVQTAFSYGFEIFEEADIKVYVGSALQTLTTHYTVSGVGNANGGTVTFLTAPANNAVVTLIRRVALERDTDYQQNSELSSSAINRDYDRLWSKLIELNDELERSLRLAPEDATADLVLPLEADRAEKVLAFDADGDLTVTTLTVDEIEDQVNIATAQAAAAQASANAAAQSESDAQTAQSLAEAAQALSEAAQAAAEAAQLAAEYAQSQAEAAAYDTVTLSITATGSDQAGATAITTDINEVTTTLIGTGVRLQNPSEGAHVVILNRGANELLVYPATGHQIDDLTANEAFSLPAGTDLMLWAVSATRWLSHLSLARYS